MSTSKAITEIENKILLARGALDYHQTAAKRYGDLKDEGLAEGIEREIASLNTILNILKPRCVA